MKWFKVDRELPSCGDLLTVAERLRQQGEKHPKEAARSAVLIVFAWTTGNRHDRGDIPPEAVPAILDAIDPADTDRARRLLDALATPHPNGSPVFLIKRTGESGQEGGYTVHNWLTYQAKPIKEQSDDLTRKRTQRGERPPRTPSPVSLPVSATRQTERETDRGGGVVDVTPPPPVQSLSATQPRPGPAPVNGRDRAASLSPANEQQRPPASPPRPPTPWASDRPDLPSQHGRPPDDGGAALSALHAAAAAGNPIAAASLDRLATLQDKPPLPPLGSDSHAHIAPCDPEAVKRALARDLDPQLAQAARDAAADTLAALDAKMAKEKKAEEQSSVTTPP